MEMMEFNELLRDAARRLVDLDITPIDLEIAAKAK